MTAGIYASRARMETILFEREATGGQMAITDRIENYPGAVGEVLGPELAGKMESQAEEVGLKTEQTEITEIRKKDNGFLLKTSDGKEVNALVVIVATGAKWNKLGIPGEDELRGKGVSYCATCDGPMFRNKELIVVGGGDQAVKEALYLSRFASKISLVHRRDRLRAEKILQEKIAADKKIECVWKSTVVEVLGKNRVEGVKISDVESGKKSRISAQGVFIFVGMSPNAAFAKDLLKLDAKGYISTDADMRTSCKGIFACGDVREKTLRQIVTAVGDGATAAFSAQHYVEELKGTAYK